MLRSSRLYTIALLTLFTVTTAVLLGACESETTAPPKPAESSAPPTGGTPEPQAGGTPSGTTSTATPPAPAEPPAPTGEKVVYTIMPESEVMWAMGVTGLFVGTRKGGWADFEGTVEVTGGNFETAKIDITVDMKSAYSDANELTEKLKGDESFFQPGKFPTSTFKSSSVKKTDAGYEVTGDLTIRDTTKSITFPVTVTSLDANKLEASATFKINRQDFGVAYHSALGDYAIEDQATMTINILAEK